MSRASAPSRGTARDDRHLGYVAAAVVFAIGMAGTTLPTPLYGLYREELGFSELMVTVIFASYAVGVIATLLLVGNHSDAVGQPARPLDGTGPGGGERALLPLRGRTAVPVRGPASRRASRPGC